MTAGDRDKRDKAGAPLVYSRFAELCHGWLAQR